MLARTLPGETGRVAAGRRGRGAGAVTITMYITITMLITISITTTKVFYTLLLSLLRSISEISS